jgi:Secretion system C-terminal sorting domain
MKIFIYLAACVVCIYTTATAQQLAPATLSSAGKSSSNGAVLLEDNVGGFIVTTISTGTFMYTQGFLQPDKGSTTVIPAINDVQLSSGSGIDNAGTTFITSNAMLEFTVGEFACKSLTSSNNLLTQGILQPFPNTVTSLPVTNLEFYAKRLNTSVVQLNWQTEQELNNRGFSMERKKESEAQFTPFGFVPSKALGGTSYSSLNYVETDNNNFRGKTYYRLRQEDLDGQFKYSMIRIVNGSETKQALMQVWPVPSNGPVNIVVTGIDKADQLMVFDATGKLVQHHIVNNNQQLQLTGLRSGTYILKLANNFDLVQKIVVQ